MLHTNKQIFSNKIVIMNLKEFERASTLMLLNLSFFCKKCRTQWVAIMLGIARLNTSFPIACIVIQIYPVQMKANAGGKN